ncbi:hypothetical protein C8J57DRAFT_1249102 [Mycena rebaudengoi]|nr:hypothetical protein C8J57DRAFT_1249102 [Mycena rebaudengoi]
MVGFRVRYGFCVLFGIFPKKIANLTEVLNDSTIIDEAQPLYGAHRMNEDFGKLNQRTLTTRSVQTRKGMAEKNGLIISEWVECAKNERWIEQERTERIGIEFDIHRYQCTQDIRSVQFASW